MDSSDNCSDGYSHPNLSLNDCLQDGNDDLNSIFLEQVAEVGAYAPISLVGLIGNIFVIAVVSMISSMRTSTNFFIVSLSVADLLVCIFLIPVMLLSRWQRKWVLGDEACVVQAVLNLTCVFASLFNLSCIAVNRVLVTKMPARRYSLFSPTKCCLYIFITWTVAILYSLFPVLGWGIYKFSPKHLSCIYIRHEAPSFSYFFSTCGVLLPIVVCAVSYFTIWVTYVQSKRSLQRFPDAVVTSRESKLTKNLFIVWLAFFICWLPMNVLFIIDPEGELDSIFYRLANWCMLCNSCVNPIIYGVYNVHFRNGYKKIMTRISCGSRNLIRVAPSQLQSLAGTNQSRSIPSCGTSGRKTFRESTISNRNNGDQDAVDVWNSATQPPTSGISNVA